MHLIYKFFNLIILLNDTIMQLDCNSFHAQIMWYHINTGFHGILWKSNGCWRIKILLDEKMFNFWYLDTIFFINFRAFLVPSFWYSLGILDFAGTSILSFECNGEISLNLPFDIHFLSTFPWHLPFNILFYFLDFYVICIFHIPVEI